jgi:hypothetical protein
MQIVIPFAQVDAINPNLPEKNLTESIAKYLRCIVVSCHSFRIHNPSIRIIVITNKNISTEFQKIFKSLNVNLQIVPFTYNPPLEFGHNFRGCFYMFDAIHALNENSLIIDPDVICLENLDQMASDLGNRISVFKPGFSMNKIINGITPKKASEIFSIYSNKSNFQDSEHIGGEAIFIPKESFEKLTREISKLWKWNVRRAKEGLPYLTTEEHILSVMLHNEKHGSLSSYISRIWTSRRYRGIEGSVQDINKLPLWHLPSEKNYGFQSTYYLITGKNTTDISLTFNRSNLSKLMHVKLNLFNRMVYKLVSILR